MARSTDLTVNDRITTVLGGFAVVEVYPRLDAGSAIEVDVTPEAGVEVWDTNTLAQIMGAEWAGWMSGGRNPRYRLRFDASVNLAVAR
jgi:hypothetical protein